MNIFVSPVFDANLIPTFKDPTNVQIQRVFQNTVKLKNSWTFYINVNGFIFRACEFGYEDDGFADEITANNARDFVVERAHSHFSNGVWIVRINIEAHANCGCMQIDKIFRNAKNAYVHMKKNSSSHDKTLETSIQVHRSMSGTMYLYTIYPFDSFRDVVFEPYED